jgi:2-methylisocitrate lyase-like PEP mutase family enzyme
MENESNRRAFVQAAGLAATGIMAVAAPVNAAAAAQEARPAPRTMGARFRALMNGPEPLICANAYDLLTARLSEVHGFKGVFVGSSGANQELVSVPDQALVSVSELIDYAGVIARNVNIPIVADLDDLGATPINVYRFARMAEQGGIACAAFDDRMPMNRASAYSVPGVMPMARMVDNIHAASDARTDMVLVARCLAPAPNGSYTEMLDRAAAYADAGADLIWLGMRTLDDYAKAAAMLKKPLFGVIGNANIPATVEGMRSAHFTVGQSGPVVNIALGAVDRALTEMKATGRMTEAQKTALNRATAEKVYQVQELNARALKYNTPVASGGGE